MKTTTTKKFGLSRVHSKNTFFEYSQKCSPVGGGGVGDEPWLDAELNEPMHITPTSSLPPNAQQINSLSL